MRFERVRGKDAKYIRNQIGILHNTAFIAYEDEYPISVIVFLINNIYEAEIIEFQVINDKNQKQLVDGFINEFLYWNPFVKKVIYNSEKRLLNEQVLKNIGFIKKRNILFAMWEGVEVFKINLMTFRVGQLTVSLPKVNRVLKWIREPEDIIVACIKINNQIVCIDGNSRLVAAYLKGYNYVYGFISEGEDIDFHKECLNWCSEDKVHTIKDLSERIVPAKEHERLWIDRCSTYYDLKNKI